jgi:hypothetical protein
MTDPVCCEIHDGVDGPRSRHRCATTWSSVNATIERSRPPCRLLTTIGLDLAKHWFQVRGVNASGEVVIRRKLRRSEVLSFSQSLQPCLVGIEACATAHYWARELIVFVATLAGASQPFFCHRWRSAAASSPARRRTRGLNGTARDRRPHPQPAHRWRGRCAASCTQSTEARRPVGSRSDGAQADQSRGRRAGQQDRPHRVGGDDARGRLPGKAGSRAVGTRHGKPVWNARVKRT